MFKGELKGQDHNGKKHSDRQWRIFGFWIIREKHERGHACNHCDNLEMHKGGSAGLWIPAVKWGWWTLWWVNKDESINNYIRIT